MSHVEQTPLFTLTADETSSVCSLSGVASINEALGECIWLLLETDQRLWVIDSEAGRAIVRVKGEHDVAVCDQWLPVSHRVVQFASSCTDDVVLALAGDSIVATAGGRSAVIDLVEPSDDQPVPQRTTMIVDTMIDREAFARTLWSARCTPTGTDVVCSPVPPMWLQVGDGTLALHIDWTDAVGGKATYRMPATCEGPSTTVAINHGAISRFMTYFNGFDADDEPLQLGVVDLAPENGTASTTRRAVVVSTGSVDFITWTTEPLRDRWEKAVSTEFARADVEVVGHAGTEWTVRIDRIDVRVVLHSGHPDIARVSTTLAADLDITIDLLTELNTLNAAATGVRFWVEDSAVHAASDVRCSELDSLVPSVIEVAHNAARYAPLLALLGVPA